MSGIKRLYWEEIEKMDDKDTPDLDELKEFVNPDEYPSDPLKEDEENYLKFVRSTMETNENIYTTEIISKQGELIADAAYMSEQEASQLKSIVQKIDPTSIVHIRSRKVKAESARDICDYVNGESTDKFFSDVPIEESSLIDMLDKLNPFSK